MAKLGINTGTTPNDGTGDTLLSGAVKINSNFTELYDLLGNGTALSGVVTSLTAGTNISLSGSTGSITINSTAGGVASTANVRSDSLIVSGVSTFTGAIDANGAIDVDGHAELDNVNISGVSTFGGNIDLNASIDVDGHTELDDLNVTGVSTFAKIIGAQTDNVIPFYFANAGQLPNASTYHGAFAHVHATGKAYFAHGGNWVEIVSESSDNKVGAGDEDYTVGTIVAGLSTLGNVVFNSGIVTSVASGVVTYYGDGSKLTGISTVGGGDTTTVNTNQLNVSGISTFESNVEIKTNQPLIMGEQLGAAGEVRIFTGGPNINDYFAIDSSSGDDVNIKHQGANAGDLHLLVNNKIGINSSFPTAELDIHAHTKITGVVTATKFVGDGAGLTGVTASGTGIIIRANNSLVGTASTINFGTNLNVSPVSVGVVTVTAVGAGGTWANFDGVSGVTTSKKVRIQNDLQVTGVVTATTFLGNLTGAVTGDVTGTATTATNLANAANITAGTIADARFPATLPASSAANLTNIPAANITGALPAISGANLTNLSSGNLTGALPAISGANLTNLDAADLASGTVPDARFPSILPAVSGQSLTGVTTDVEFAGLQAQVNTLANNLNIIGFYNATAGVVTSLTVIGESRGYIGIGSTLPSAGIHTGDYLIVSTNGENVGIASFLTTGISTAFSGDWIVGASGTEWEVLSYSSSVVAPRATRSDFAATLETNSSVNTTGIITAASFTGDGTNLTGVASTDYIVTGTAATFNNVAIFNDNLRIADNVKAQFGTGFDLQIYHDGSNSYLSDTGALRVGYGGTTELYFSTSKKLETVSTGATVTGTMFATQFSGGGLMAERTTVSGATTAIGNNGIGNTDITGFKSYALMKVGLSTAGWFRLYTDSTSRTNDASRSVGIDPSPGSGVIAEVVTTGVSTSQMITPFVTGGNMDEPATTTMYASVKNLSGVTTEISVNLTLLQLEA